MVLDGEVGALTGQAESKDSLLFVFICRVQGSYDLRRDRIKKLFKCEQHIKYLLTRTMQSYQGTLTSFQTLVLVGVLLKLDFNSNKNFHL